MDRVDSVSRIEVILCEVISTFGVFCRVTRERICHGILFTLEPFGCEIVSHESCSETLKMRIFDLVKSVTVENGDERVVVCHHEECGQSGEKHAAFLSCPCDGEHFELNNCVTSFRVGEVARISLNCELFVSMLLLEYESDACPTGICQKSSWLGGVIKCHDWGTGEEPFGDSECFIMRCGPNKVVFGAEERSKRRGGL